ncbi:MAG TPA: threonine--tRNA ligase [Candidatus Krumholzibacteria bacterium]|nr:threonine--tRNA ligase [Candidatus Krumholzibacteria bacterium]
MVRVTLPDGSTRAFDQNEVPVSDVVGLLGQRAQGDTVGVLFGGQLRDVYQSVTGEGTLRPLRDGDEQSLYLLRHTASHVLAHAVQELFPDAKFAIGPPIDEGFYYDFEVEKPFTPEDLARIETRVHELLKKDLPISREVWDKARARAHFAKLGQRYKLELIDDIPGDTVSIYTVGNFVDLCAGPHIDSSRRIKYVKLLSTAGAYWRGDSKQPMLQRIYATAFFKKSDLDAYLTRLAEAEKRDHRRLGKALDLFDVKDEAGGGLVFWHPKGAIVREQMEQYLKQEYRARGYQLVFTPHIAKADLWKTSGHLTYYRDNMFMMDVEGQEYVVKPMNCPGHILIYKRKLYSYRELPVRIAEMGTVYRRELSGALHGLLRVRGFTQDDGHIFCAPEQLPSEVDHSLDFALSLLQRFGFDRFAVELSVRDPANPSKYAGTDEEWTMAEAALEEAVKRRDLSYKRMEGEAVFYGPKIDVKVIDAIGRPWQLSTIQFDFNLPRRFDVNYVASGGERRPVFMVHRALFGSIERFMGILTEHYAGAFPTWLAPVQCVVLPVSNETLGFAERVRDALSARGVRVEMDAREEKIGYRVREAELHKVPYMAVVGEREAKEGAVAVRTRGKGMVGTKPLEAFVTEIVDEVAAGR